MNSEQWQGQPWDEVLAARLRLAQADLVDLPGDKRRELLSDELSRHLKDVPEPQRAQRLQALLARFPVDGQVRLKDPAPEVPLPKPAPQTLEQALERFLEVVRGLPEARKAEVQAKLAEAGLGASEPPQLTPELLERFRKCCRLRADQMPRPARVMEAAVVLAETLCQIDDGAAEGLREVAPGSPLLHCKRLRDLLARLVIADQPIPTGESFTRGSEFVVGLLLYALQNVGEEFADKYLERMSPKRIWDGVQVDKKIWENSYELAWKQYKELAMDFDNKERVSQKIRQAIRDCVEKKLKQARKTSL